MHFAVSLAFALLAQPAPPDAPGETTSPPRAASESERLRAAAEQSPQDAEAWARLGSELLREGRTQAALEPLRTAVELDPGLSDARYNLAYALRELGRLDAAADAYRSYLEEKPGDADAWFALAQTEESAGDLAAAAAAYDRYADVEARPAQARWVEQAREKADQLRARAAAAPAHPDDSGAVGAPAAGATERRASPPLRAAPTQLSAAVEALEVGQYDRALDLLRRDAPNPTDGFALAAYGSAHLGRGELGEADRYFARAAAELRGEARLGALLGRAEATWADGRRSDARAFCREILENGPADHPWVVAARARVGS
jgi:tetratricopeptide (TPR) repeat protein